MADMCSQASRETPNPGLIILIMIIVIIVEMSTIWILTWIMLILIVFKMQL